MEHKLAVGAGDLAGEGGVLCVGEDVIVYFVFVVFKMRRRGMVVISALILTRAAIGVFRRFLKLLAGAAENDLELTCGVFKGGSVKHDIGALDLHGFEVFAILEKTRRDRFYARREGDVRDRRASKGAVLQVGNAVGENYGIDKIKALKRKGIDLRNTVRNGDTRVRSLVFPKAGCRQWELPS